MEDLDLLTATTQLHIYSPKHIYVSKFLVVFESGHSLCFSGWQQFPNPNPLHLSNAQDFLLISLKLLTLS